VFTLNHALVEKARAVLSEHSNLYWLIGGSCAGKSTICRALSSRYNLPVYDMDEHIYGSYMGAYSAERHPASTSWFAAPNPLEWIMGLAWQEFDALTRTADAEVLDLLADDLVRFDRQAPLLTDGGVWHASILAQALSPARIACIDTTEQERVRTWEQAADRAEMRGWISELPNPTEMWAKFLEHDRLVAQTIAAESRENAIAVFARNEYPTPDDLARRIALHIGL
jgi:hypothetical protein